MNLIGLLRDVMKAASSQAVEVAGASVCGPFWPMLRSVFVPIVAQFAVLPSVPDERLAEALRADGERGENARAVVDALSGLFAALDEQTFRILVVSADTRAEILALNLARRQTLYWQLFASVELAEAWFLARNSKQDPSTVLRLRTACAQVGLSGDAINHILYTLGSRDDVEEALLEFTSTLDCAVHPFVGAMARTGSLLIGKPDTIDQVVAVWEVRGVGATVRPYVEAAARVGTRDAKVRVIGDLITAVTAQG